MIYTYFLHQEIWKNHLHFDNYPITFRSPRMNWIEILQSVWKFSCTLFLNAILSDLLSSMENGQIRILWYIKHDVTITNCRRTAPTKCNQTFRLPTLVYVFTVLAQQKNYWVFYYPTREYPCTLAASNVNTAILISCKINLYPIPYQISGRYDSISNYNYL